MLNIWNDLYEQQEKRLYEISNDNTDLDAKSAAIDIIDYRNKLKKESHLADEICFFSYQCADDLGNEAYKYGLDKRGDGYFWIKSILDYTDALSKGTKTTDEFRNIINELMNKYLVENKD